MLSKVQNLVVFSILSGVTGLSKISIELKPYQYQYVDPYTDRLSPLPEPEIPAFKTLDVENIKIPSEWEEPSASNSAFKTTANVESTALVSSEDLKPIMPKRRKLKRKPRRRKPKKMHLRRVFKTRLITTTPPMMIQENRIEEETTTTLINLAPIYDAESGISYSQNELNKICSETVNLGQMSFYWQQGLPQQQDTGQPTQQQGQWDFINLGGAPVPQHQWNANQQQQAQETSYYYQQPPQQQVNGLVQHQQQQQQQVEQNQWAHQQSKQATHQPQLQQAVKPQQTAIEHTPLFQPQAQQQAYPSQGTYQSQPSTQHAQNVNFTPAPPVLAPNFDAQQQQYYQPAPAQNFPPPPVASLPSSKEMTPEQQVPAPSAPVLPTSKKEDQSTLTIVAAPPPQTTEQKTKVTPTSSEDDWEKADMEVEVQSVDDENKRQKSNTTVQKPAEKQPEGSRESSSLGGSWSQQDASERSSAEPAEIVENSVIIEEKEDEKTPRVSLSENRDDRLTTPEVVASGQDSSLNHSSPGVAMATSTPKDVKLEKRTSVSSQGTIVAEKQKQSSSDFKKPELQEKEKEESGNNSDSTLASGRPDFERGHARASYREYKKTYMEICDRLKIMRSDSHHSDYRPSSKLANPLLAAAGIARHPAIRRESIGGRNDGRASVPLPQSQSFTDGSFQMQNGNANANGRRNRVSRLDPNARPSSRQAAGYQSANLTYDQRMMYDQHRGIPQNPHYRQGRYSSMGIPFRSYDQDGYDPRRPQSSYMMEPYAQEPQETSSLSESEEDDENVESDDELRRYNMQQQQIQRGYVQNPQYQYQAKQHQPTGGEGDALYYCGVVHVNMDMWRRVKEKYPIPAEFNELSAIEKAAFMFYAVVFKQPYKNVDAFHKRFNREFYKYVCAGDSDDDALFKICRSMQQQFHERQKEKELAFQTMKSTLFSDDTSLDGQSEINSVYEESLNACDVYNNGPLKFTCPHSFLHISTGGQIISIQPDQSISAVVFDDIKSTIKDIPTLQIKEAAQAFKGPLIPNQSAPHTVRLYISKQIDMIKRSDVARENPEANDVVESLLVWQLLETMVKQQGNITGPDIAELLAKVANQPVNIEAPPQQSNITPALNQFTQFLLGGHIDEAVESAIRNGLFADALVLTRRLFPNDERRIEQIESRFLQTRSLSNPVTTLVSVAKGEAPPVLTNPPMDDHLSWRTHAAIILANLDQRGTAMKTIYSLGRALAKRDYHCAADFCFLVCCVLGGDNPFAPQEAGEGEEDYRRHISLINSDIPDNEANPKCQYGFLISDLHATEIFDYALRLKDQRWSPLSTSVEYQTSRIKYAKLLANHGFNSDAYRYCTDVARTIWTHLNIFKPEVLLELAELADSLHFAACASPDDIKWIEDLRSMVQMMLAQAQPAAEHYQRQEIDHEQQLHQQEEAAFNSTPASSAAAPELVAPQAPSPAPSQLQLQLQHPEAAELQHLQRDEFGYVPPTPAESVHNESFAYPPQAPQQQAPQQQAPQQPIPHEINGFTTSSDNYNDGPFTSSTSVADPQHHHQQPVHLTAPAQVPPQQDPLAQQSNGWLPNQVTSNAGETVEQEAAPAPPVMQPSSAAVPPPIQAGAGGAAAGGGGGGLRAVRGAARYAKLGLSNAAPEAAPPGMMPLAPPTATFGFMPAPMDNGDDSFDPFSGQADPTIHQSAPQKSDE
uniref:Protein transport protein sec16 n=1 Tax=Caenorhabditis japonica TaxID=281687 RepID=A0A8R1I5T7_CAEJA